MNSQPTLNTSATSDASVNASTTGSIDEVVPTFRPDQGAPKRRRIDLANLTESSANFLLDPFTYHSIFAPDGNLRMSNLVPTMSSPGTEGQVSSVTVTRQSRVSTESDALTEYLQGFEGIQGEGGGGDQANRYLSMLFDGHFGGGDVQGDKNESKKQWKEI